MSGDSEVSLHLITGDFQKVMWPCVGFFPSPPVKSLHATLSNTVPHDRVVTTECWALLSLQKEESLYGKSRV